jgi:hypothetical protein
MTLLLAFRIAEVHGFLSLLLVFSTFGLDFKGRSDYVNDINKNFNICVHSSCEKEHNP